MHLHLQAFGRTIDLTWNHDTTDDDDGQPEGHVLDHMPPSQVSTEPLGYRRITDPLPDTATIETP